MLFKLSNLNSNLALTLGYLNPALNNSALNYSVRWETPLEFLKKTHLLLEIFISLRVVSLEKLSGKSLIWLMLIIIEIKGVILIKLNEGQFFVISRWNMIIRVSIILNRTVVVDSDWRFNNLCGSHLQIQS